MKPTVFEMERALDIVRDLISYGLNDAIDGDFTAFCDNAVEYAEKNHIRFACGASKIVIIDEESDWVTKISFDCSAELDDDMELDYCKRELYNYKAACEKGLDKFFAEIHKVGEVNGIDVYLQEKVRVDEGVEEEVDEIFRQYVYAGDENYYDEFEDEDERRAILEDGVSDMDAGEKIEAIFGFNEELINFVEDYDINDLHSGNYGYRGGELVIIDFSGYNVYSIEEREKDNEEDK